MSVCETPEADHVSFTYVDTGKYRFSQDKSTSTQREDFVLIVDDDQDFCEILSDWIHEIRKDLFVFTAYNGDEAVNLVRRYSPGIVFLDIGLGRSNGIDVCGAIRALPEHDNTNIVGLTGGQDPEVRRRMLDAGADEIISKTSSMMQMVFLLNRLSPPRS